jgi:hypothetical protein
MNSVVAKQGLNERVQKALDKLWSQGVAAAA